MNGLEVMVSARSVALQRFGGDIEKVGPFIFRERSIGLNEIKQGIRDTHPDGRDDQHLIFQKTFIGNLGYFVEGCQALTKWQRWNRYAKSINQMKLKIFECFLKNNLSTPNNLMRERERQRGKEALVLILLYFKRFGNYKRFCLDFELSFDLN